LQGVARHRPRPMATASVSSTALRARRLHKLHRPRPPASLCPSGRPCSSSSTIPKVDGMLSFLLNDDEDWWSVLDHCNGLLLCNIQWRRELCVCNPATRWWTVQCFPTAGARMANVFVIIMPVRTSHSIRLHRRTTKLSWFPTCQQRRAAPWNGHQRHGHYACFHQGLVNGRRGLLSGKACQQGQSTRCDWIRRLLMGHAGDTPFTIMDRSMCTVEAVL